MKQLLKSVISPKGVAQLVETDLASFITYPKPVNRFYNVHETELWNHHVDLLLTESKRALWRSHDSSVVGKYDVVTPSELTI